MHWTAHSCFKITEKNVFFPFSIPQGGTSPPKQESFQRKQEHELLILFVYIYLAAIDTFFIS